MKYQIINIADVDHNDFMNNLDTVIFEGPPWSSRMIFSTIVLLKPVDRQLRIPRI